MTARAVTASVDEAHVAALSAVRRWKGSRVSELVGEIRTKLAG